MKLSKHLIRYLIHMLCGFRINETHVLFWQMGAFVTIESNMKKSQILEALWKDDKLFYVLNLIGLYKELEEKFDTRTPGVMVSEIRLSL